MLAEEMKELRLRSIVVSAAELQGLGGESCAVALGREVVTVRVGLIPAPRGGHDAVFQIPQIVEKDKVGVLVMLELEVDTGGNV